MKVIGAGFGRTGTMSLYTALNMIPEYARCYHMHEVIEGPEEGPNLWIRVNNAVLNGEPYEELFDKIFSPPGAKPYLSTVDHPSMVFFEELLKLNPNALVILTIRDTPEVWYESCQETIMGASGPPAGIALLLFRIFNNKMYHFFKMAHELVWNNPRLFNGRHREKEFAIQVYKNWIEHVKKVVPPKQLLIFNVKQGWEPLCKFLKCPVPKVPFPRVNDRQTFIKTIQENKKRGMMKMGLNLVGTIATAVAAVLAFRYIGRSR